MNNVQAPNQVIKEKISAHVVSAATKQVLEVLDSKPVEAEWLGWLDRAFQHSQTHDALLFLLINGIKDNRFLDEVIPKSIDLLQYSFNQRRCLDATKDMTVDCLVNEPRVVNESLELCKWFVSQDVNKSIVAQYMIDLAFRPDMWDMECWRMSCAGYDGVTSSQFINDVTTNFAKVCNSDKVVMGSKDALLYKPLMSTMTLGMYNNGHAAENSLDLTSTGTEAPFSQKQTKE